MTTQTQITEVSAPVGPNGDAAFVSSTTAPRSLIFKPGTIFASGGPVKQNIYTSGNGSGVDGYLVLQGVLNGTGLFPAVPLGSSTVELDFSESSGSFTLPSSATFGTNCTLKGIDQVGPQNPAQLNTNGHTITGLVELNDVFIQVTGTTAITEDIVVFSLRGESALLSFDTNYVFDVADNSTTINVYDSSVLGTGANPCIHVGSTGTLFLNLFDGAVLAAGALTIDSGGTVYITIADSGVSVDHSLWGLGGVAWTFLYQPLPVVTYQPGGSDQPGVFTEFEDLCNYIVATSGEVSPQWTI